jgi:hypothetical protein
MVLGNTQSQRMARLRQSIPYREVAMKRLLAFWLLWAISGLAYASEPDAVLVSLDVSQTTLVQGFPFVAVLRLTSSSPITVDLGENRSAFLHFEVKTPSKVESLSVPVRPGLTRIGTFALTPGAPYEQTIVLPASDFPEAGWYSILARVDPSSGIKFEFLDSAPTFEILPHNSSQMQSNCGELSRELENASSAGRRIELAAALSSVRDPIALPYLQAGIGRNWGVDSQMVAGIEHVGTREALEVLSGTLHSSNPEVSLSSKAALHRIRDDAASSPELKYLAASLLSDDSSAKQ